MKDLAKSTLVSVVMPTYNHEDYVRKAIEGVLLQETNFQFELIIVEDCSVDNTKKIVQEYADKYPQKITGLFSDENLGVTKNYIRVVQSISGKYVALCEGDDYWTDPLKLQKQVDFMEANRDCSMCFHPVLTVFVNSDKKGVVSGPKIAHNHIFTPEEIVRGVFIRTVSMFFKTEAIRDLKDWVHSAPLDDLALQLHCASKGNVGYIGGKPMSVYNRGVERSWSAGENSKNIEQLKQWYKKRYDDHITVFNMFNTYTNQKFDDQIQSRIKNHTMRYMGIMLPICNRKEQIKIMYDKKIYLKYFSVKSLGYMFARLIFGEKVMIQMKRSV